MLDGESWDERPGTHSLKEFKEAYHILLSNMISRVINNQFKVVEGDSMEIGEGDVFVSHQQDSSGSSGGPIDVKPGNAKARRRAQRLKDGITETDPKAFIDRNMNEMIKACDGAYTRTEVDVVLMNVWDEAYRRGLKK